MWNDSRRRATSCTWSCHILFSSLEILQPESVRSEERKWMENIFRIIVAHPFLSLFILEHLSCCAALFSSRVSESDLILETVHTLCGGLSLGVFCCCVFLLFERRAICMSYIESAIHIKLHNYFLKNNCFAQQLWGLCGIVGWEWWPFQGWNEKATKCRRNWNVKRETLAKFSSNLPTLTL